MARRLLWKEWRQLRVLRWCGVGLGLLLPLALAAGAEASARGWSWRQLTGYTREELFLDALPAALAFGLWPLFALLASVQTFAADRAAGTEVFLLDWPVPRGRIWRARVLACTGSLLLLGVLTGAAALCVAALGTQARGAEWSRPLGLMAVGVTIAAAAFAGGMAAASAITAPLAAMLVGLLLAGMPAALAVVLAEYSSMVWLGGVPLGGVLPLAIFAAYPLVSWVACCRGEPAGRGRWLRAACVAGGALALVAVVHASAVPVVLRANSAWALSEVAASPRGRAFVAMTESYRAGGAWIVDLESGQRLRFLPPPVYEVSWSGDGGVLAVVTQSGPLGSFTESSRIEIYDARGRRILHPIGFDPAAEVVTDLRWAGPELLVRLSRPGSALADLVLLSPRTGRRRTVVSGVPVLGCVPLGPTAGGSVYVALGTEPIRPRQARHDPDRLEQSVVALHRVDPLTGRLGPPLLQDRGLAGYMDRRLSPSGRWWVHRSPDRRSMSLVELGGTRAIALGDVFLNFDWLQGDRIVWLDAEPIRRVLRTAAPGDPPRVLGAWSDRTIDLQVSPDRRHLLVQAFRADVGPPRCVERRIYTFPGGSSVSLAPWPPTALGGRARTRWAAPDTLARLGPGFLALESPAGGPLRTVLGSPPD